MADKDVEEIVRPTDIPEKVRSGSGIKIKVAKFTKRTYESLKTLVSGAKRAKVKLAFDRYNKRYNKMLKNLDTVDRENKLKQEGHPYDKKGLDRAVNDAWSDAQKLEKLGVKLLAADDAIKVVWKNKKVAPKKIKVPGRALRKIVNFVGKLSTLNSSRKLKKELKKSLPDSVKREIRDAVDTKFERLKKGEDISNEIREQFKAVNLTDFVPFYDNYSKKHNSYIPGLQNDLDESTMGSSIFPPESDLPFESEKVDVPLGDKPISDEAVVMGSTVSDEAVAPSVSASDDMVNESSNIGDSDGGIFDDEAVRSEIDKYFSSSIVSMKSEDNIVSEDIDSSTKVLEEAGSLTDYDALLMSRLEELTKVYEARLSELGVVVNGDDKVQAVSEEEGGSVSVESTDSVEQILKPYNDEVQSLPTVEERGISDSEKIEAPSIATQDVPVSVSTPVKSSKVVITLTGEDGSKTKAEVKYTGDNMPYVVIGRGHKAIRVKPNTAFLPDNSPSKIKIR